jgi:hypothetical protein
LGNAPTSLVCLNAPHPWSIIASNYTIFEISLDPKGHTLMDPNSGVQSIGFKGQSMEDLRPPHVKWSQGRKCR